MENQKIASRIMSEILAVEERSIIEGLEMFGIKKLLDQPEDCYQGISEKQVEGFKSLKDVFSESFIEEVENCKKENQK